MGMRRSLGLLVLLVGAAACHGFRETERLAPGETARVVLHVTRPMDDGTQQPIYVEGVVVSSSLGAPGSGSGFIALQRSTLRTFRDVSSLTYDTVRVAGTDIGRLERRGISWAKTGFVAFITGAVAFVVLEELTNNVTAGPGG